jgi:hypothetical protein
VNPRPLKLKIEKLDFSWCATKFKGRIYVATPNRSKPRDVTAESWGLQIVEVAQENWKQNLAIPMSLWPKGEPNLIRGTTAGKDNCFHVLDNFCGLDGMNPTMPVESIRGIIDGLARGEDILILSNSKKISGFIPAVITRLTDTRLHILKLWYPFLGQSFELTEFQLGYLYGLTDADQYQDIEINWYE